MNAKNKIEHPFKQSRVYLAILVCLGVTAWIYWREASNSSGDIHALNWTPKAIGWLAVSFIMIGCRDLAYIIRIRLLTKHQFSWKVSFRVILLWEFASAITPGVVGGSAAALFLLKRENIPMGRSTAIVLITLIFDNLFYVVFIPLIFVFVAEAYLFPEGFDAFGERGIQLFWLGYFIILAITALLIYSVFYSSRLITALVKGVFKLPYLKKFSQKGTSFLKEIDLTSAAFKREPFRYWAALFGLTIWSWLSRFLVLNFVLLAFIEMGMLDQFIALARQLMMWLIMIVTPTPGGSGMAEYAFTNLFADYVLTAGVSAISLALIWRSVSYYPYLLIGSVLLPRWLRKTKKRV